VASIYRLVVHSPKRLEYITLEWRYWLYANWTIYDYYV